MGDVTWEIVSIISYNLLLLFKSSILIFVTFKVSKQPFYSLFYQNEYGALKLYVSTNNIRKVLITFKMVLVKNVSRSGRLNFSQNYIL